MIFRHCTAMFVQYWTNKNPFQKITPNTMSCYVFKVMFDFQAFKSDEYFLVNEWPAAQLRFSKVINLIHNTVLFLDEWCYMISKYC